MELVPKREMDDPLVIAVGIQRLDLAEDGQAVSRWIHGETMPDGTRRLKGDRFRLLGDSDEFLAFQPREFIAHR